MSVILTKTDQNTVNKNLNSAPDLIASSSPDLRRVTQLQQLEPLRNKVPIEYLDDTRNIRDGLTHGDITITVGQESKATGALKILLNRLGYYDGGANGYSTVANQALVDAWQTFKEKCSLGGGTSPGVTSYEKLLREVSATGKAPSPTSTGNPAPARTESAIEKFPGVELHRQLPDQNPRHNQNADQIRRLNPQATSVEYGYVNGTEAYFAKTGNQYKVYRDLPTLQEVGQKNQLHHAYTVEVNPSSRDVKITTLLNGSNIRAASFTGND